MTITAECQTPNGAWKPSTLTYTEDQTGNLTDIANTNGVLTLESSGPLQKNGYDGLGKYVPAGSYQQTTRNVSITIQAQCLNDAQKGVASEITYTANESVFFQDLQNDNGVLKEIT